MSKYVFDLEANGLLEEADTIWCGVFKNIETQDITCIHGDDIAQKIEETVSNAEVLVGQNIIDYDLPLMEKVLGIKYEGEIYDTFLMSMMLCPDRKKHPDCKKGPHSLENWGCIFGRHKPEHEDWSKYSDEMLHRCQEDTEITYLVWKQLSEEMGINA